VSQTFTRSITLETPRLAAGWLEEPRLRFAGATEHEDPKVGITLAGPRSFDVSHPADVHVGFIGTAQAVDDAAEWLASCAEGVPGDDDHDPFPGTDPNVGFRFHVRLDTSDRGKLTAAELREVSEAPTARNRFESLLSLLDRKMAVIKDQDEPPTCVIVVLSDDLVSRYRVVNYRDKGRIFHRDLRRAFKALAMRHGIPTQLLRHATIVRPSGGRGLDHPATVAWNLFTGLCFKARGAPWAPVGISPGTCAIGISFYRPLGDDAHLCTSVVQAFDEDGDVFVLRGEAFPWDEAHQGRQPHLTGTQAAELIDLVHDRYRQERGHAPRRVVIHKRSRFNPDERDGFANALGRVQTDLVALRRADEFRLLRQGQYPPLRGTWYTVGDHSYLYTTGYLHRLRRYPHGHVPAPLEVADHVNGDTPRAGLLAEILLLTKMNWNSAGYAETAPITLRFANLVGDILRELPAGIEPQRRYAFYM
jgi:hypothetical protein